MDEHPGPTAARGKQRGRGKGPAFARLRLALLLLAAAIAGVWACGCKVTEKNYRALSFFFDGVPDPNAPAHLSGEEDEFATRGRVAVKNLTVYQHKPYADAQNDPTKCNVCHETATGSFESFSKLEATICMKCHAEVPRQYPVMHGPVAAVECLWCHDPHESTNKGLLRDPAPQVCVQCHDRELLPVDPPQHLDKEKSCLDCHVAHGGPHHGLLIEGVTLASSPWAPAASEPATRATSQPATEPATAPATQEAP